MTAKVFTIHVRFSDVLYDKIIEEGERLGMSQTDTVRYLLMRYFEAQAIKKEGGAIKAPLL